MERAAQEKLEFDVIAIIDDAITSLCMCGCSNQTALRLLMIQAAIRMPNAADVRSVIKSIEEGLVDDGPTAA